MPVAPVVGFNPFQTQAFGQVQGMQGMTNPYFQQAARYVNQSAQPLTDVSQYFNPMTDAVTKQLQNIFGQQNRQATTGAVQAAGGIGADRIGVTQANLANQQTLGAGQVYANLYQQAQAAAQADAARKQAAGYAMGQLGPAAQAANLQATGALGGAGAQQQALAQAQANAPYQNILAQLAYPFQTSQFLAGITGGLAPAFGGTTTGYGTSQATTPVPSALNQALGIGTSLAGIAGNAGMFGTGKGGGSSYGSTYGAPSGDYGSYGGISYPTFADGGSIDDRDYLYKRGIEKLKKAYSPEESGFSSLRIPNAMMDTTLATAPSKYGLRSSYPWISGPFADGGDVSAEDQPPPFPYLSVPKTGASPIPNIRLPMGGGEFHNRLNLTPPQPQSKSGSGSDAIGGITKLATTVLPFILARGGAVNPYDLGQGFQEGGDIAENLGNPFDNSYAYSVPGPPIPAPDTVLPRSRPLGAPDVPGNLLDRAGAGVKTIETGSPQGDYQNITTTRNPRTGQIQHALGAYQVMENELPEWTAKVFGEPVSKQEFLYGPNAKAIQDALFRQTFGESAQKYGQGDPRRGIELAGREWFGGPGGVTNTRATDAFGRLTTGGYGRQVLAAANPQEGEDIAGAGLPPGAKPTAYSNPYAINRDMQIGAYHLPTADQPYPDALQRDWGQNLARSPWMSLIRAGAAIASTTGPVGTAIAKGIGAGAGELEAQRKELRTEQDVNLKADALYQQAQRHLDEYTRIKPYQAGELAQKQQVIDKQLQQLELEGLRPFHIGDDPNTGLAIYGIRDRNTGQVIPINPMTGQPRVEGTGPATEMSAREKVAEESQPKAPAPLGVDEFRPNLAPTKVTAPQMVKGPFASGEAQTIKGIDAQMNKERDSLAVQHDQINRLKMDFATVMKDNDKDGFFTRLMTMPGADPETRVNAMKKANLIATAAGKQPVFSPEKVAAIEEAIKIQKTMGMSFAATISPRDAMQMQLASISAQPGFTQSPQGMQRLIGLYDGLVNHNEAKHDFWGHWKQENPRTSTGWEEDFRTKNPVDMFTARALIENMPNQKAKAALPKAVEELRQKKDDPAFIARFDRIFNGTSSFFLNGKLDPYAALR